MCCLWKAAGKQQVSSTAKLVLRRYLYMSGKMNKQHMQIGAQLALAVRDKQMLRKVMQKQYMLDKAPTAT